MADEVEDNGGAREIEVAEQNRGKGWKWPDVRKSIRVTRKTSLPDDRKA